MKSKLLIVVLALVLGATAALLAAKYLTSAKTRIQAEAQPVEVLVAQEDVPRGLSAEELVRRKIIVRTQVPRQFVSAGAVSSYAALDGQVLAAPLSRGEQVTKARFQFPSQAGLAYSIPKDLVALAIPNDDVKGVAGLIKPGDMVMVLATFEAGADGEAITKVLLQKARVLAVGASVGAEGDQTASEAPKAPLAQTSNATGKNGKTAASTITLGLAPADVERVVFAEEKGKVWLSLLGAADAQVPATPGRTTKTVFAK